MLIRPIIAENLRQVRERVAVACLRAERSPADIQLVAVTKYAELDWVRELVKLGETQLGESRPQQLLERAGELGPSVAWHLIGTLQRNKVRAVLPACTLIHSVDSLRLLETIDRVATELNLRPRVLLEVNMARDPNKHGFAEQELFQAMDNIFACTAVKIDGLMTMPALSDDPEDSRKPFERLRDLRDRLRIVSGGTLRLPELSMGMSGDFEVAIEEGATLIRVGSALWDGLTPSPA